MQLSFSKKLRTTKWMFKDFFQNLSKPLRTGMAKKLFKSRLSKSFMATASLVFLCSLATLFVVQGNNRKTSNISEKTELAAKELVNHASNTVHSQSGQPSGKEEGEVITIIPSGFDPKVITRPKGRFTLLVDNRSGLAEVQLRLDRIAGSRLHDVLVPRQKLDWVQGVDLPPGNYLLTEANHPGWACAITITAN